MGVPRFGGCRMNFLRFTVNREEIREVSEISQNVISLEGISLVGKKFGA